MLKIAHKIIFIYSAITLCAIGMAFAVLSYWMSDYADNLYYSFLEERAELIAQKIWSGAAATEFMIFIWSTALTL